MQRVVTVLFVVLAVAWGGIAAIVHAQTPPPAASEDLAPGLKLTFTSNGVTDARPARLIAISVPANSPPTPFLQPGPFTATWEGFINLRIRGEYAFHPAGNGSLKVLINDKPALTASGDDLSNTRSEPFKLTKGKSKIRVEYTSPEKGDAIFRLYWAERGPVEPLSPAVFFHNPSDAELRAKWTAHEGRALFGQLRCIQCHTDPAISNLKTDTAMPELLQDAPDLSKVPFQLNQPWLAAWIANPRAFNPRAEMPQVFASADPNAIPQEAADIASYLVQINGSVPSIPPAAPINEAQVQSGMRLYTDLGCIACHTPPDFQGTDAVTPARIPHKHVRAKYNLGSLIGFLKAPQQHFRWIRMPDFKLTDEEAASLAQYLLRAPGVSRVTTPREITMPRACRRSRTFRSPIAPTDAFQQMLLVARRHPTSR
jgi:mono/diheme cytochrome c family protein